MSLLDQFRRPDRGTPRPGGEEKRISNPFGDAHTQAATATAVAEESLPEEECEENAA